MTPFLLTLAAVVGATQLLGALARRIGQPAVLGELLAGVFLGGGALALLDPHEAAMGAFAQLGLFVLLFQIGLHTDVKALRRVGPSAIAVAVAGVVLPFGAGFLAARALGIATLPAVIAGASLTATSMAISARVLGDKGLLRTSEGQVVLGAALADDVIGLAVLSVVVTFVGDGSGPARGAAAGGTAMIVGAFVAGVLARSTQRRHEIERTATELGRVFVPVYFAVVGATVDLPSLAGRAALVTGAALIAAGVAGKVAAGFAPRRFRGNRLLIGVAMVPRGEVGLVFAQMGLATGAIAPELFGAIMLMVVVTTFVTPPLLNAVIRRDEWLEGDEPVVDRRVAPEGRRRTAAGRRHEQG